LKEKQRHNNEDTGETPVRLMGKMPMLRITFRMKKLDLTDTNY
jgi:hypothetical protein